MKIIKSIIFLFTRIEFYGMLISALGVIKITKENINSGIGAILIFNAVFGMCWGMALGVSTMRNIYKNHEQ